MEHKKPVFGTNPALTRERDHDPRVEVRDLEVMGRVYDEEETQRGQVGRQQLVEVTTLHGQSDGESGVWKKNPGIIGLCFCITSLGGVPWQVRLLPRRYELLKKY